MPEVKERDISSVSERSSSTLDDIAVPSLSLDLQEATEAQTNELRGEEHWTGAAVSALIGDALQAVSRWWNAPVLVKVSESDPVDPMSSVPALEEAGVRASFSLDEVDQHSDHQDGRNDAGEHRRREV